MTQRVFDMFIMLVIVLSSIALALEDPVAEDENQILKTADYVFTGIFAMECSLKVGCLSRYTNPLCLVNLNVYSGVQKTVSGLRD